MGEDGGSSAPGSEQLRLELGQEAQRKEMLELSVYELRNTISELEKSLSSVEDEGNEWKTRYETQVELNRQLERQTVLLQEKMEHMRGTPTDRLSSIRSFDQMPVVVSTADSEGTSILQRSVKRSYCQKVDTAINTILLWRIICLTDLDAFMARFTALGFPNCSGVMDSTHIPIRVLDCSTAQYINRNGYYFIVLQALVNHCGQFLVYIGWSSRAHDAQVIGKSSVGWRMEAGTYFSCRELAIGDVNIPLCIVGDTT
ncbi:coiled-coil domain-containing protein 169 isoform X1 [Carettochelys insculpta]|uniref:coiled-coil domain-containing protein 169 isoform X1 n=1 Tax=Carettochelys insculpta TaxID=44489 RepID=UPI003EBCFF07